MLFVRKFLNLVAGAENKKRIQPNFRRTKIVTNNQEAAGLGAVPGSPLLSEVDPSCVPWTLFFCPLWPQPRPRLRPRRATPEPPCRLTSKATSKTSRYSLLRSPTRLQGYPDSRLVRALSWPGGGGQESREAWAWTMKRHLNKCVSEARVWSRVVLGPPGGTDLEVG